MRNCAQDASVGSNNHTDLIQNDHSATKFYMPRAPSYTPDNLAELALMQFWVNGYNATSMDALVRSTGISRHGIYTAYGDKHALFQACFTKYQELVVSPAFSAVEKPDANLDSIAAYFEMQITAAEVAGLPGPGCFVTNSTTEIAPHDTDILNFVAEHNDRLRAGFLNVITNVSKSSTHQNELDQIAQLCVVFTNGLWSMSRVTSSAEELRGSVALFLHLLKDKLS